MSTNGTPPPPDRPTVDDAAAAVDDVALHASTFLALWVTFRLKGDATPADVGVAFDEMGALADSLDDALEMLDELKRG